MTPIVTGLMGLLFLTGTQSAWAAPDQNPLDQLPSYSVTITAYNAVPSQTDSSPFTTASGAYSNPDIVAARSQDLADELPFGTVVAIVPSATSSPECGYSVVGDDVGLRVIADTMNARMHNKVDILLAHQSAARTLGVCKGMQVVVVGHIDVSHMPKTQADLKALLGDTDVAIAK